MSYSYKTRTVRTVISDGKGPPRVETNTYTDGDDGGSGGGLDFGSFKSKFGRMKISIGDDGGHSSGGRHSYGRPATQRPHVSGRSTRKEKKNPFAGLSKQSYDQIVSKCKEEGCVFEDPEFAAEDESIFFSRKPPKPFEWKRPGMKITVGGGGTSGQQHTQRPQMSGRATRKDKKNPFAGLGKQNYDEIVTQCKASGSSFVDPEFPAEDGSIFFSKVPEKKFEWKRPHEICDDPQFVTAGASRFDVQQGELGDCWLLAAVASLTCSDHLLNRVIMPDQDFTGPNYCGCFKFHFWHQGEWQEVVVDDRLPTYYNSLVFMHSTEKNEFWSALLEKAYAKLNGSYESLKGGSTCEAMEDFTGGVTESFDLNKAPDNLFTIMMKAADRGSLMGCSLDADPNQLEARLDNGLVMGHAYSVTGVNLVEIQTPRVSGKIPMVRVRNPWGNEAEWKGAWSDKSEEWNYIPEAEKKNIGLSFDDDGEFWMSYEDWTKNFEKLEICNLGPDSLDEDEVGSGKKRWEATAEHGEWIPRVNAGGCRNYLETFATNPQYRVTLTDPDDDDDEDKCSILIGLLQKDRRKKRKEGLDMLTVGYVIYKLKEDGSMSSGPLDVKFFKYNGSAAKSPSFINMREICGRHKLDPGTYVIIPSTFEPNQQGEFLLRIFSEKASESGEMDEGTGIIENQRKRETERYGSTPQPDPYANREPLALGFDLIVKEEYKPEPTPWFNNFPGQPGAPGYQPYGYDPNMAGQAPPGQYGYPGAPPQVGFPGPGGFNQYDPGSANPGYQPGYPNAPPAGAEYQPSQYYPNQSIPNQYQQQPGFAAPPQGQYPNYPAQGGQYQDQSGQYPAQGGQYPAQGGQYQGGQYGWGAPPGPGQGYDPNTQQYPYGQGEEMQRAQSNTGCMAEPPPYQLPSYPGYSAGSGDNFRPPQSSVPARAGPAAKKEGPPMTEEDAAQGQALRESFKRIAGEDLEIDAYELKEILNTVFMKEFNFDGFSVDICRSMVAMHDGDLSGKLGFDEFKTLWQDLRKWKAVFKQFDKDKSGHLSTYELRGAFNASGFRLSNRTLSAIIMRFSNKEGEIEFDDFVLCAIRLKTMLESFKNSEGGKSGCAAFELDDFVQMTMYS